MATTAPAAAPTRGTGAGAGETLRAARTALISDLLTRRLPAGEFPRRYTEIADAWLADRFTDATGAKPQGYALVAVGGHGRSELCPGSDFDLVLLHKHRRHFAKVAESIWYATWDVGVHLDHSVRTKGEALTLARTDLKVILGLLDGRVIAGEAAVAEPVISGARELFQRGAPGFLHALDGVGEERRRSAGDLAFLLEPDLKLSSGGLRDIAALRALGVAYPSLARLSEAPALLEAERIITSVRCILQARTGSTADRLLLQEQDQVADVLGFANADALMGALAEAGRVVAARLLEGWRRARAMMRAEEGLAAATPMPIAPGIVVRDNEVGLAPDAKPRERPQLLVEVALAAAERNALLEPESIDRLARETTPPPRPWPLELRESFVKLLSTGDALVPVIEALDQRRLFELLIPEWRAVRNKPQRNAFHRFTVDRHLLEAVARAGEHLGDVERPDLLLIGTLLHDIGKGFPGDHSEVGRELVDQIAKRMGFNEADRAVLVAVVAYHLVLPEFATRRDLDDPSTADRVAKLVQNKLVLHLLAALTEADSQATGTAAWGQWKAELVQRLVERTEEVLDGKPARQPRPAPLSDELQDLVAKGVLAVRGLGRKVTVIAPDREGLFAIVTGVLALRGCNVRRANIYEGAPGVAVEVFDVEPVREQLPKWEAVEGDLAAVLEGRLPLAERLAEQELTYSRGRRAQSARPTIAGVDVDASTSALATIVEVRAADRVGLLHQVTDCIAQAGLNVIAALVDTLGHEVIDTFYVRESSGEKLTNAAQIEQLRRDLLVVARGA